MNLTSRIIMNKPLIKSEDKIIVDVNNAFTELTGYSKDEVFHISITNLFIEVLKSTSKPGENGFEQKHIDTFIFTKDRQAREVIISTIMQPDTNNETYVIREKANSRLDKKFPFAQKLMSDNHIAVGIYSAKEFVLLQANQSYISIIRKTYNETENVIGLGVNELFPWWEGSIAEKIFLDMRCNRDSIYQRELEGPSIFWDDIYIDNMIPISENGKAKFIFSMLEDVTEKAKIKNKNEEQADIIRKQKDQLETIIENMSDALYVIDKDGVLLKVNKAGREIFHPIDFAIYSDRIADIMLTDLEGNEVATCDLPQNRIKEGISVSNQKYIISYGGYTKYVLISAAPLYDSNGEFISGILCVRDITQSFHNEQLIKDQQSKLLETEKEKNSALQLLMDMKDEFLITITHEFKTPLTIIDSAIQTMNIICPNELSDKVRKYHNIIRQNTNRQLRLVNNLLDITRMNAGRLRVDIKNMDIVLLTKTIVDSIVIFAEYKNIKLSFASDFDSEMMGIDEEKYERIILNLLSNAVKFTPEGKSVAVRLSLKINNGQRTVCIQVQDDGIGIPEDKKEYVFEKFGQVGSVRTRQAEGTGIGLYLVKLLVDLMGGEIELDSKLGFGSTFTILLPIQKAEQAPVEPINQNSLGNNIIHATALEFSDFYLES